MTFFGVDGSHYQKGLKIKWLKTQGYSYFMAKCTQGTGFVDSEYDNFRLQADACNMPFVAYHFLEHGNGANQAKHLAEHIGDKKIPVMVDFEPTKFSHPTWRDYTDFRKEAKAQGLNLINNLVYLPKWYWSEIKTPKLDSLTLVQSY
ncbi:MAG TPA: GH25 family lysozyme, partial [Allocoleopsis sp.]